MLAGIYTYNIDQKGRIVMPGRFLDEIGNPFVLGGHPNGYLVAASSLDQIQDKTSIRGYVECRIKDRTGRFVIPNALREYADLVASGEATVIGLGDEVEIWNKRRWESQARLGNGSTRGVDEDSRSRTRRTDFETYRATAAPPADTHKPRTGPHGIERRASPHTRTAVVTQKTIYGQPYIQVEGQLGYVETDRVLARLETALRGRPRTIFLDLRKVETVDASFLMAMEPATHQLAADGGRLAIMTERQDVATLIHRLCTNPHTRVFLDLESALWWLVDEGHA